MSRSLKKGPFCDEHLAKKVEEFSKNDERKVIKTWLRHSTVLLNFVGRTTIVRDGRKHIPVYITDDMVGRKLREFIPTRTYKSHIKNEKTGEVHN